MSVHGFPPLVGHMQTDGLSQVIPHPSAGLYVRLRGGLHALAGQPQSLAHRFRIGGAFMVGRPIGATTSCGVALQCASQAKHGYPLALHTSASDWIADVEL